MTTDSGAVRHERGDISPRRIVWGAAAIAACVVLAAAFSWLLIGALHGDPNGANSVPAFQIQGPRLQTDGRRELAAYQASKQKILDSGGWTNDRPRRVRIPIQRAMQLMAQGQRPAPPPEAPR
jgi:hypothetical protein